jgi:hypothetical protein
VPLEAWCWLGILAAAALTDPTAPPLLELCPLDHLGLWCPGDGLGTGLAYALRFDLAASFASHPLAPFAAAVLPAYTLRLVTREWRRAVADEARAA